MTPEYARYQLFLSVFNSAFTVAAFIFAWWRTREKVSDDRFAAQGKRLADIEGKVGNMPQHCTGHNAIVARQDSHTERLAQFKELLTTVETELKHLPTVRDIEKLYVRMDEFRVQVSDIKSEVSKVTGAMPGITHLTEMMNEFLLHHGGK